MKSPKADSSARKDGDGTVMVTPKEVKKLRDKTGAGMLDCKNALIEAEGDFEKAERILKEQGLASAEKRIGRATNNGAVFTFIGNGQAAMAELTCETDFVAKNAVFRSAGEKIAAAIAASGSASKSKEVETMVKEAIAVLKENMTLGRVVYWEYSENEIVVNYSHNGGIIGVMVKLAGENAAAAGKDEVKTLAFDLALHAAAYKPAYLQRDSVDPEYIKEQEEIFTAQANSLGDKPENVIKGIVQGKLNKHLAQICFMEQDFVKENKKSVKQVIDEISAKVGGRLILSDYSYIAIGRED